MDDPESQSGSGALSRTWDTLHWHALRWKYCKLYTGTLYGGNTVNFMLVRFTVEIL